MTSPNMTVDHREDLSTVFYVPFVTDERDWGTDHLVTAMAWYACNDPDNSEVQDQAIANMFDDLRSMGEDVMSVMVDYLR